MRQFISICDLCATQGTCTPATAKYKFQDDWQDVCKDHLGEVTHAHARENIPLETETYDTPGDVQL